MFWDLSVLSCVDNIILQVNLKHLGKCFDYSNVSFVFLRKENGDFPMATPPTSPQVGTSDHLSELFCNDATL